MSTGILHLISSSGFLGAEHVVLELGRVITGPGYRSAIGIIENRKKLHAEFYEAVKQNKIDAHLFPCQRRFDPGLAFRIRKLIEARSIDILHCHGYKSNLYGLLGAGRRTKTITTGHLWKTSTLRLKLYCALDGYWTRRFDRVIAVSDGVKEEMVAAGTDARKIVVIDNGIHFEKFDRECDIQDVRKELCIDEGLRVIGAIGSLTKEKGQSCLLKAFEEVSREVPNLRLVMVGDGELREELEEQAHELGLNGSIVFTGSRKDIPEMLSLMDIFVLPSLREGLPMVLLEAMASGKSIIAANVGGVSKAVVDNETGLLIAPGDSGQLKEAMLALLSNTEHARSLGRNARRMAREKFSAQIMAERYCEVYEELMAGS